MLSAIPAPRVKASISLSRAEFVLMNGIVMGFVPIRQSKRLGQVSSARISAVMGYFPI